MGIEYIRINNVDFSTLTSIICEKCRLIEHTATILIEDKEYKFSKFKETFLCRHDWAKKLKKNKSIIIHLY
jgi:hypothetical protein